MTRVWILCSGLFLTSQILAQNTPDPAELQRINAAITKIQAELASARNQRSAVTAEILESEKSIQVVVRQIEGINTLVADKELKLPELEKQAADLENQMSQQQELIGTYLRNAWLTGNQGYLKLLLSQQDPHQSARMLRYYQYLNNARTAKITEYNQTLENLNLVKASINGTTEELQQKRQELFEQENLLASAQQERQDILAKLDASLLDRGDELEKLEQEKIEISLLLEELRRSISNLALGADQEAFSDRKGKMGWPLEGRIEQTFGSRHSLGDLTWEGVTIAGTSGEDIQAIHHGRVVFADWFSTSGLLLIIDHGDGYMSLYAHNQDLYKTVGEWVAAGEVIAAVGNTGGNRDYGLYFEIRHDGKAENPSFWCSPRN
jgi:septal ring factor EnvC (AmiA/AmiB activator)